MALASNHAVPRASSHFLTRRARAAATDQAITASPAGSKTHSERTAV